MQRYIWSPGKDKDYLLFYSEFKDHNTKKDKFFISWMQGDRGCSYCGNKSEVLRFNLFNNKMNIFENDAECIMSFLNGVKKIDIDITPVEYIGKINLWRLDIDGYKHSIPYYKDME